LIRINDKQIPIIKNVLTPIQFFNKLPVDIIGQNKIAKVANEINPKGEEIFLYTKLKIK
tara:strand:+ start:1372 stop:1548 length:177 start_codon:yes stop_codon:yes gene_type:complete